MGFMQYIGKLVLHPYRKRLSKSARRKLAREDFRAAQALWLEKVTRGSLLQEFTRDVTEDGPENWYRSTTACFKPLKVKSIHDIFDANAEIEGSRKHFSKDSLFALFVHHLPPAIHADLSACREIMSRSILHFACFPFSTSEAGVTDLTWDAFIRSLTFLTDRDKRVFRSQYSTGHSENGEIIRESFGRERTITIRAEEIFRSMALPNQTGHHADAHIMHKEDVLDVLHQVQPKPDYYYNQMFCNAKLRPIVEGLSAGRCPLGCYFVPKSELIRLIDFFRRMLRTITTAQGRGRSVLERRLRRKSAAITMIPREKLSFVDVEEVSINTFIDLVYAYSVLFLDIFLPEAGIRSDLPFEPVKKIYTSLLFVLPKMVVFLLC